MEHEMGGSGLMRPPNARHWHWLPVSPDDDPAQWAQADIWERYPLPGQPLSPPHTSSISCYSFSLDPCNPLPLPRSSPLHLPPPLHPPPPPLPPAYPP